MKISETLSQEFDSSLVKRSKVDLSVVGEPSKLAYILENVLTQTECEALIAASESAGFEAVPVSVAGKNEELHPEIRKGFRLIVDDEDFTSTIWSRIESYIPPTFYGHRVVGLNERLRFLRYDPGDKFEPHEDANYARPDGSAISLITLQIYLNEGFVGGETTFLAYENESKVQVVPKIGMILVFQQDLLHEGSKVVDGIKYTIRTDVMYTHQPSGIH